MAELNVKELAAYIQKKYLEDAYGGATIIDTETKENQYHQ